MMVLNSILWKYLNYTLQTRYVSIPCHLARKPLQLSVMIFTTYIVKLANEDT